MPKPDDKPGVHSAAGESITLTIDQLRTLIAEARSPAPPSASTVEEAFDAHRRMMEEAKSRAHAAWYVAFVSRETNARGVAYVGASRRHASGRVLNLPRYVYPPGSDRTRTNGGICDMAEIVDKNGQPLPLFKQWRYEFWKADLRGIVGGDSSRLHTVGQPRPTLEDAIADLEDYEKREAVERAQQAQQPEAQANVPKIVAREVTAP